MLRLVCCACTVNKMSFLKSTKSQVFGTVFKINLILKPVVHTIDRKLAAAVYFHCVEEFKLPINGAIVVNGNCPNKHVHK